MKRYFLKFSIPVFILALLYTGCTREGLKYVYKAPALIPYAFYDYANNNPVIEKGTVSVNNLSFEISFQYQQIKTASVVLPGNAAYALSIKEPIPVPLEKIIAINIKPLTDYSSNSPARTNMNDRCTFHYSSAADDTTTLANIIDGLNNPEYSQYNRVYFRLKDAPSDIQSPHRFIIEIITDNNSRLADTSTALYITQ